MWNRETALRAGLALLTGCLVVVALAVTGPSFADGPADDDIEVEIKKRIAIDCDDGEDCGRRMIIIGDDGETHQLGIAGDIVAWTSDFRRLFSRHGGRFMGHHGKGGFLGVSMSELSPELRTHFGVPEDAGVMVSKVVDDSPASRAGIQVGDIISAVDGEAVASGSDLARAIRGREADQAVDLEIWREGRVQILSAAVEERKGHGTGAFYLDCDDDEDCDFHGFDFDHDFDWDWDFNCGDGEKCDLEVDCEDGDCTCTINGEAAECRTLGSLHDLYDLRDLHDRD